jgi:autotransporter translocation and assembly factor TamB
VKRPGRLRRFVVRPLFWGLALVALAVVGLRFFLVSGFARERARALVEARVSEALGRDVSIGGLDFDLLPLTVVLTDVVIPGDRPGAADFARVHRLRVEADVEGWRSSRIELRRLDVDGLEMNLEFREDGDNLPRFASRGGGGRSSLTVVIDGLSVRDSRVKIDERTAPVAIDARAVLARFAGLGGTDLEGSVTAQQVAVVLPRAHPVEFTLSAKARLLSDHLEFSNARLLAPGITVRTSGQVGWRDSTRVDLTAAVESSGAFLDTLGYLHGDLRGPFHAEGTFGWRPHQWGWRARIESPGLDLFGFRVDDLAGLANGDARAIGFDLERGRFAGGAVHGSFSVGLEAPRFPARLDVRVDGAGLDDVLARFGVPVRGFAGEARGELAYDFDLREAERGSGEGRFDILAATRVAAGEVPAAGSAVVRLARGAVDLPSFELASPAQRASGSVHYELGSGSGRVDVAVDSQDVGLLLRRIEPLPREAVWLPTAGSGTATAHLDIARGSTRVEVGLDLTGVVAPGLAADTVRGDLVVGERAVERIDLNLHRGTAAVSLAGRLPFDPHDTGLSLDLTAEGWPAEDARPWLPFALPLSGPVHGELRLSGTTAAPAGDLVASVEPATLDGIELSEAEASLTWDADRLTVTRARAIAEAGTVEGHGTLSLADHGLDFAVASTGLDLSRAPLDRLGGESLAGRLVLDGRIAGTLDAPRGDLDGRIEGLAADGSPLAEGPAPVSVHLADGQLAADLDVPGLGRVTGGGPLALDRPSHLTFRLDSGRLDRLIALAAGPGAAEGLSGSIEADLDLALAPDARPTLGIVLPALEFRYGDRTIRSQEPVRATLDGDGLRIESFYLGLPGSSDELFVAGRIALGARPELDLNAQVSLDASWFRPFLEGLEVTGRIDAIGRVRGTPRRPEINGEADWSGGRFLPPVIPHSFEKAGALVLLYPDAVVLDRLDAEFAGGTVTASGRVDLPTPDHPLAYRFEAAARGIAPRWPAGWQMRGDADLSLTSTAEGRQLRGEVTADRVWYLQDIDLSPTQLIQRLLTRSRVDVGETDERLATTTLGISIRAPQAVRVRNNVATLSGSAELALRGTLARPILFGEVTIAPGGTVTYSGNTYTVERGAVTFANPSRIEPLLDVVTHTRVDQYAVTLNLSGSLERLNTTFASDPPLPDLDILGLLATGAPIQNPTFSEVATAPTSGNGSSQSVAAEALLYGQAASLLTARVGRLFGFDQIRVEPLTTGDTVSTARVTVGKRLSRKLYVTYSLDPSSTAQQILQVEWRLTDKLVLVLTQNGNESYAVDARWESRY